jgi:UDP-N-acetylglucosamine 2-epimerase
MKNIITMSSIRPDFIRMSEIFKKLDANFNHTLIHTGQHFDFNLSDVFFGDLNIRKPDYNFSIGNTGGDHIEQLINLTSAINQNRDIFKNADLVMFLGDSNSVLASVVFKKMGLKVAHIEAGMRSGDSRMFEEVNRITCDHASDIHFCYHEHYKQNLVRENIGKNAHVVGNTIVEVVKKCIPTEPKENSMILVDIHRQENLISSNRLANIIRYAQTCGKTYGLPVKMLKFNRTFDNIEKFGINLKNIQVIDLMGFKDYVNHAYHSKVVISDSGTAQEELAFLHTPVIVPRDFTERYESVESQCSVMLDANDFSVGEFNQKLNLCEKLSFDTSWLGDGNTSQLIINHLGEYLK